MRNVARCWTAETAVALDEELDPQLPFTDYYEYFGPDYGLPITPSNMEDLNQPEYLAKIQAELLQNLSDLEHIPSVPFHERPDDMPTAFTAGGVDPEKEADPDKRTTLADRDSRTTRGNEFEDSDDDDDEARGSFKPRHRRNIGPDYQAGLPTAGATGGSDGGDALMPVWSVSGSAI